MCGRRLLLALVLATALAAVSGTGNFSTVLNGTQTSGSPPPSPPSPPAIQFGGISSHVPLPTVEALLNTTDEELLNSTANPYLAEGLANLTALAQLAQLEVPPCDAGSFPSGGSTSGAGPGDGKGGGGGGHPRGPTFLWLDWLKDGLSSILPWSRPGSFDPDLKAVARDRAYRDELLRQLPPQTYQVWTVQQAEGSPFATSPTATTTIAAHTSDASTAQGDAFEGATLAGPAESDVSSSSRTHLREADLDNNTDEPPAKRTRAAVAEVYDFPVFRRWAYRHLLMTAPRAVPERDLPELLTEESYQCFKRYQQARGSADGDSTACGSFADALVSVLPGEFAAAVQQQAPSWAELQQLEPGFVRAKLNDLRKALDELKSGMPDLCGKQMSAVPVTIGPDTPDVALQRAVVLLSRVADLANFPVSDLHVYANARGLDGYDGQFFCLPDGMGLCFTGSLADAVASVLRDTYHFMLFGDLCPFVDDASQGGIDPTNEGHRAVAMKVVTTLLDLGVRVFHISSAKGGNAVRRALSTDLSPFTRWTEAQVPYAGETVQTLVGLRPSGEAVVFPLADHRSNRRYDTSAVVGAAAELAAHSLAGGQPTLGDKARLVAACRALPEPDDPTFARWLGSLEPEERAYADRKLTEGLSRSAVQRGVFSHRGGAAVAADEVDPTHIQDPQLRATFERLKAAGKVHAFLSAIGMAGHTAASISYLRGVDAAAADAIEAALEDGEPLTKRQKAQLQLGAELMGEDAHTAASISYLRGVDAAAADAIEAALEDGEPLTKRQKAQLQLGAELMATAGGDARAAGIKRRRPLEFLDRHTGEVLIHPRSGQPIGLNLMEKTKADRYIQYCCQVGPVLQLLLLGEFVGKKKVTLTLQPIKGSRELKIVGSRWSDINERLLIRQTAS